jgi:hypothetical protein
MFDILRIIFSNTKRVEGSLMGFSPPSCERKNCLSHPVKKSKVGIISS